MIFSKLKSLFKKKKKTEESIESVEFDPNFSKFRVGSFYFLIEKEKKEKLMNEYEKTVNIFEKIGYEIDITSPDFLPNGHIWVSFDKKPREEHFRIQFYYDKKTKKLIKTCLYITSGMDKKIRENFIKKFGDDSITSGEEYDIFYPIAYLQKEKLRLTFA